MPYLCQIVNSVAVNNFPLKKETIAIGRSSENDLHIEEASVSLKHAVIEAIPDETPDSEPRYRIRDLESTNGTQVNGKNISSHTLVNNDLIRIGVVDFKYVDRDQDLTQTVKIKKSWIPGVYYTS